MKTRALNLVEAHKEFAEAMEDKEHFSKLHSRIEKAVLVCRYIYTDRNCTLYPERGYVGFD